MKGGTPLEVLGGATVVVFDKTGTLTTGERRVVEAVDEVLAVAAAAEQRSAHPLAAAIRAEAGARGLVLPEAGDFREDYGDGVEAFVGGVLVRVGRASFVDRDLHRPASPGIAEVWVSRGGRSQV